MERAPKAMTDSQPFSFKNPGGDLVSVAASKAALAAALVGATSSLAIFSHDRRHRYYLERNFCDPPASRALFVMLNPSNAGEIKSDPTVDRCMRRARNWGYDSMAVVNLFTLVSADPGVLRFEALRTEVMGPRNDEVIIAAAESARIIVCGWGREPAGERPAEVLKILHGAGRATFALKINKDGTPAHPLYLPYSMKPFLWRPT